MSLSSAFQTLRLQARSVSSSPLSRSVCTQSKSATATGGGAVKAARAAPAQPHAPHQSVDLGVAGPSRCFCSSHGRNKASEVPLEELHFEAALDDYRHEQLSATHAGYWQPAESAGAANRPYNTHAHTTRHSHRGKSPSSAPPIPPQLLASNVRNELQTLADNNFFTPATQRVAADHAATLQLPDNNTASRPNTLTPPSYVDSLPTSKRDAFEARLRVLTHSGEFSMPALAAELGDLCAQDREQVCCHIMTFCIHQDLDARRIWDLYFTWSSMPQANPAVPSGPMRSVLRRMQEDAVFRCCDYITAARMTHQAAVVAGDARLRPSQSRHLVEQLVLNFRISSSLVNHDRAYTAADDDAQPAARPALVLVTRPAVCAVTDVMVNLMVDGVAFKRKTLNRVFKLLCVTHAHDRLVRLVRAAQRRAQIDLAAKRAGRRQADELRAAGGFSRLRTEATPLPQVLSTVVVEECMWLLCAQNAKAASTAYEVLCTLDPEQRTADMYDALMTVYGNAPILTNSDAATDTVSIGSTQADDKSDPSVHACSMVDAELWHDINTVRHVAGPTLRTMSSRIICHARTRRLELIKSDLHFMRASGMGGLLDLSEAARLAVVRCHIKRGELLQGYRHASTLLATQPDEGMQERIVHTLLQAAQHVRVVSGTGRSVPSRAGMLERFLRHFSRLHRRFPALHPSSESLRLFVQLLDSHSDWISTDTLWKMLRTTSANLGDDDARSAPVLEAFAAVFHNRGEVASAQELRALVQTRTHKPV
ncbi:hypothetical protein PaG_05591 [Moesziomyces aphidis]|uniref:Uncharacterized protein n=1 Tax=Moesziomyces aphidis TaxID=84754 RepID=W3VHW3_MOEAP|nr:hypothetical protein PaG_05591 [Moesziomyces aphidis]